MSTLTNLFTDIANAIRTKKGTTDLINATDFANEILNISGGSSNAVIIPFAESLCPTVWSNNEATNDIGTFKVSASTINSSSTPASNAFDSDSSSSWRPIASADYEYVQLELPTKVSICPTSITATYQRTVASGTTGYIQGYNEKTSAWENLCELERTSASRTDTFSVTTSNFYTKFRTYAKSYASSSSYAQYIYDLKITAGKIKIE